MGPLHLRGPTNTGLFNTFGKFNEIDDQGLASNFVNLYTRSVYDHNNYWPLLSFAWEQEKSLYTEVLNAAKKSIRDSDAIVIIGYSFPFFNRSVDKDIFSSLAGQTKIYVQDVDPDRVIRSLNSVLPHDRPYKIEP